MGQKLGKVDKYPLGSSFDRLGYTRESQPVVEIFRPQLSTIGGSSYLRMVMSAGPSPPVSLVPSVKTGARDLCGLPGM